MVAACAKHFPGHGDTSTDSHLSLPVVAVDPFTLAERELAPFTAAIQTGIAAIMTSHIMVPALDAENPATFSSAILGKLLRDELGFTGVIVTDALDMAGASAETGIPVASVRALRAGADLLCLGTDMEREDYEQVVNAILHAVHEGTLDSQRLRDAAARNTALATHYRVQDEACEPCELVTGDWSKAFETTSAVEGWIADPAEVQLVQVDTDSNMAVGHVPWGLSSVAPTQAPEDLRPGAKVLLAARALSETHAVHELAAQQRQDGHRVLVVNFGWPAPRADITTYGASPVLARTVIEMLQIPAAQKC